MHHKLFIALVAVILLNNACAFAQTPDQAAIANLMHATFDRPESPLTVAPVVVAGDHALAGWTQGDMGGRALLRRKAESWVLILCAGDGIKSREALVRSAVPAGDAASLERALIEAEAKLPPQQVAMLSRFEGLVMMDGSGNHPPVDHSAHGKH
jgi:hypothetical protein